MFPALLLLAVANASISSAGDADQADGMDSSRTGQCPGAIGPVAGSPQWIGLGYERIVSEQLSLGVHAGTLGFISSFGGRLLFGPTTDGLRPRMGMGLVLINAIYREDEDDPEGLAAYAWPTIGLVSRGARFAIAVEVGWLFTGNRSAGLGQAGFPAFSISLLTRL